MCCSCFGKKNKSNKNSKTLEKNQEFLKDYDEYEYVIENLVIKKAPRILVDVQPPNTRRKIQLKINYTQTATTNYNNKVDSVEQTNFPPPVEVVKKTEEHSNLLAFSEIIKVDERQSSLIIPPEDVVINKVDEEINLHASSPQLNVNELILEKSKSNNVMALPPIEDLLEENISSKCNSLVSLKDLSVNKVANSTSTQTIGPIESVELQSVNLKQYYGPLPQMDFFRKMNVLPPLVNTYKRKFPKIIPPDLQQTIDSLRYSRPQRQLPGFPAKNRRNIQSPPTKKVPTAADKMPVVLDSKPKEKVYENDEDNPLRKFMIPHIRITKSANPSQSYLPINKKPSRTSRNHASKDSSPRKNAPLEQVTPRSTVRKSKHKSSKKQSKNLKWKIIIKQHSKEESNN